MGKRGVNLFLWLVAPFVVASTFALIICAMSLTYMLGVLWLGPETFPSIKWVQDFTSTALQACLIMAAGTSGVILLSAVKSANANKSA